MFGNCKNSKKKGDAGLGSAISYFTLAGIPVSIPLTDSQDYDLVVEIDGILQKLQVKTTEAKSKYGVYRVGLRVCGGNSKSNFVHRHANEIVYDLLYVLTDDGSRYLIPKSAFDEVKSEISLGKRFEMYKIQC